MYNCIIHRVRVFISVGRSAIAGMERWGVGQRDHCGIVPLYIFISCDVVYLFDASAFMHPQLHAVQAVTNGLVLLINVWV